MRHFLWVAALLASGCVPKQALLAKQALRFDGDFSGERPEVVHDDRYWIHPADALSTAVAAMEAVVVVGADHASSDWRYSGVVAIDDAGEHLLQARERVDAVVLPGPAEVEVRLTEVREVRDHTPAGVAPWTAQVGPVANREAVTRALLAVEEQNLRGHMPTADPAALLEDLRANLPVGFTLLPGEALVAERSTRRTRKKAPLGTWVIRETLTATTEGQGVTLFGSVDYRFDGAAGEGTWLPRDVVPVVALSEWAAGALRVAVPAGRMQLTPRLAPVVERALPLSESPAVPRMRAMPEIEEIITRRAYAEQTGRFRVCLTHVLVNPKGAEGDWDLPGGVAALELMRTAAGGAADFGDQLNAMADKYPPVATAIDQGLKSQGVPLDRQQVVYIARLTERVSGWASRSLPVQPDVAGSVTVAGRRFEIPEHPDTFRLSPQLCGTEDYRSGGVAAQVQLWDLDLQEHDPIGACRVRLAEAISGAVWGTPCGLARVFLTTDFLFSRDQIGVVGLPPL